MGRFKEFLRILQNKNPKPATPGGTPGLTPNVSRPPSAIEMPPNSTAIVPLYMYPLDESTWEPLHKAIDNNPDLHFVIVINPNSGPGEPPAPDASYSRELPLFNARANVTTVGYVRIDYCKRSVEKVLEDVAIYSGWSKNHESDGIYVEGIFLDESPNEYTADIGKYLNTVSAKIKEAPGFLGQKLIIHNPGTIPDKELTETRPEITAVFEESYARYRSCGVNERKALDVYDRKGASYILHSVPRNQVKALVRELRPRAEYIFVTDRRSKYYEGFGDSWNDFIRAMVE